MKATDWVFAAIIVFVAVGGYLLFKNLGKNSASGTSTSSSASTSSTSSSSSSSNALTNFVTSPFGVTEALFGFFGL